MIRRTNISSFQSGKDIMLIEDQLDVFLKNLKPTTVGNLNLISGNTLYKPKNGGTRINDAYKKPYKESYQESYQESYKEAIDSTHEAIRDGTIDDSDTQSGAEITIPPLNTDLRMTNLLPEYDNEEDVSPTSFMAMHPHGTYNDIVNRENFSWHSVSENDTDDIIRKKALIHPVQNQHMCGSCWAMALASCISDCFVVAGVVNWMPRIAPTFIMMTIPKHLGNDRCDGGNPASTAFALESIPIADTTCIDYSWCANDKTLCTSASAANHFRSSLGSELNKQIPSPESACYFDGDRHLYRIDSGTEALYITDKMPDVKFRDIIKRHIIEFGPPLAGYAVLANFINGYFTNENVNQGIYFDRARYSSDISSNTPLVFNDAYASKFQLSGLHAVAVVGWGIGKNVQYDTDKYGDVPYWIARNSWGSSWGHMKGYFKIAMYPWNKFAQFGKQIYIHGSTIGGMILVRCTQPPTIGKLPSIHKNHFTNIIRSMDDEYYKSSPIDIIKTHKHHEITSRDIFYERIIICIIIFICIGILIKIFINKRKASRAF